jgi:phosphoglycolate phosphatase
MPLVLFDIDKTLTQSVPAHKEAFRRAFVEVFGIDTTTDVVPHHTGMTTQQVVDETMRHHQVPSKTIQTKMPAALGVIADTFLTLFKNEPIRVLLGVRETLQTHANHQIPLGLLTGNLEAIARAKMTKAGLMDFFVCGGFGEEGMDRADILRSMIKRARQTNIIQPTDKVFVVGDTPHDIAAAKTVGVFSIGVATGKYSTAELKKTGGDWVLENLTNPQRLLKIINKTT